MAVFKLSGKPIGRPKGSTGLLSKSYKKILGHTISEDLKQAMNLPDGATYADAIATNVVGKALGQVKDDEICFVAIKELRETTEGKTAEKIIAAGGNAELAELAKIMAGTPAPPDGDLEDEPTEDAEDDFHKALEGTEE